MALTAVAWRRTVGGISLTAALLLGQASFAESSSLHQAKHEGDFPTYPVVKYGTGEQAERIKRGEYLVKAGDCIACHTGTSGKKFAGGLAFKTPFGTIYSTNITPDKKTGIGLMNDKQFVRAMREGIRPDGSYYFPVFPYPYFNKMSKQDVLDIKAYLFALPAIEHANQAQEMPIPFRWRFMQLGWRTLFFTLYKGQMTPDPTKSKLWNRGAYLVEGPGHCGMCHTPMNLIGGPKRAYALTGGFVDGFYAPNISSTALSKYSMDQIEDVWLNDNRVQGGKIVAKAMLEVNHDSLAYLKKEDLDAMVVYLKSVVSKTPPKKKVQPVNTETGRKVYNKYCVACHTTGAGGAPKMGDIKAWKPRIALGLNVLYKNAIVGIRSMPAKGGCPDCSNDEIQASVDFLVESVGGRAAMAEGGNPVSTPLDMGDSKPISEPAPLQKPTLIHGKKIYDQVCALCHNEGQLGAPKIGDQSAWAPRIEKNLDVLVNHTINGFKANPVRGGCNLCTDTDIIAAVKYMMQESKAAGDYSLW